MRFTRCLTINQCLIELQTILLVTSKIAPNKIKFASIFVVDAVKTISVIDITTSAPIPCLDGVVASSSTKLGITILAAPINHKAGSKNNAKGLNQ